MGGEQTADALKDSMKDGKDRFMTMMIDPDIAGIIPGTIYVGAWGVEMPKGTRGDGTVFVDNAGNKTTVNTFVVLTDKDGNLSLSSRPVNSSADIIEVLKEAEKEGKHIADSTLPLETEFIKEQNKQTWSFSNIITLINPNPYLVFNAKGAEKLRNGAPLKSDRMYLVMPKTNTAEDMALYREERISSLTEIQSESPLIGLGSERK